MSDTIEGFWLVKVQEILRDSEGRTLTMDEVNKIKEIMGHLMRTRYGLTQIWLPGLIKRIQKRFNEYYKEVDKRWEEKVKRTE